jgi:FSR family fosmidomycin resistance protein-like MFS transporter
MFKQTLVKSYSQFISLLRGAIPLTLIFLIIEFFDELNYAVGGAALPAIRTDLALTYAQIGLLLGLPHIIGTLVEPIIMLLGDTPLRKTLVVGGGVAVCVSLIMIAGAGSFPAVLGAFILSFPASGAFVTLSQATLMDLNPGREPHMMARWTVAGSLGDLIGPLMLAAGLSLALGWRWFFIVLGAICLLLTLLIWSRHFPKHPASSIGGSPNNNIYSPKKLLGNLWEAVHTWRLIRWIVLLQLSDLLLDVFTGYITLYFTDVVGISLAQASMVLGLVMLSGLASNLLLIPLLERFSGRAIVRVSAGAVALLYVVWLMVPWPLAKIALVVIIRLSTYGWYEVLQGEAYAAVPGRSGTVMAIGSMAGLAGGVIAWLIGWIAGQVGLVAAMWLLLLGPVSLVVFVPRPWKGTDLPRASEVRGA